MGREMEVVIRAGSREDYAGSGEVNGAVSWQKSDGLFVAKLRQTPDFIAELSPIADGGVSL